MNETSLRAALAGLPVPDFKFFESIPSSNDVALQWAEAGAAEGCLVAADEQTAGRGRLGRKWVTNPGAALAFSLIFRPEPQEYNSLGLFSPLGALALADALERRYGLAAEVKWPNDVLINRRKTAGILVEAAWLGASLQSVVVGIGVNIAPEAVPPQGELIFPATSIETELGRPVERLEILRALLEQIFNWRAKLTTPEFRQAWENRLAFRNELVEVRPLDGQAVTGRVLGMTPDGNLRLATVDGKEITIAAGDVRLRPM